MGLRYSPELLDQARAYVARPVDARRDGAGMAEITRLYSAITGQDVASCRQCQYLDFLKVVTNYIAQATTSLFPETMSETKYTITNGLEGEIFTHAGYGKNVTLDNLTDEDAEFFIKNGYKHAFVLKSEAGKQVATDSATEVTPESPLVPQADLEAEQAAHVATKALLEDAVKRNTGLDKAFGEESDLRFEAQKALAKEQDAHKATKEMLKGARKSEGAATKERDELSHKLTAANEQIAALQLQLATPATPSEAPGA